MSGEIIHPLLSAQDRVPAPALPEGNLVAESVPAAETPQPLPIARILLPLVMVVMIGAVIGLMVAANGGVRGLNPMMLMFPVMMSMGMLMMFSPQQGHDHNETRRTYLRHLSALSGVASENARAQLAHELHLHPDSSTLWSLVGSERMWEYSPEEAAETLLVRVGVGPAPLCTPIDVPEPQATEDIDPVCAVSLRHTVARAHVVDDIPVIMNLLAFPEIAISGTGAQDMVRSIIAQLCFRYGPDAVALRGLGQWKKECAWLPHSASPATGNPQALIVVAGDEASPPGMVPTCVIRCRPTVEQHSEIEELGLCMSVAEDGRLGIVTETGVERIGYADALPKASLATLTRRMCAYVRPVDSPGSKSASLPALLGVADLESTSIRQLWQGRTTRLRVPIGVDEYRRPVMLDIKESAHGGMGPHGLCIGATGSGKSELLRTLVVAMAATHRPEDLNMVLVDFKGGATFLGMETLPHTAAVITNLEEEANLVERMRDALTGEMHRRQELLRRGGNYPNVTEYNKAYPDDPLPALFIVVDEFSELLGQHPDFVELFVAIGRLGRSLHMHLLLASQRLEEGRLRGLDSHLSYRIGLRTFSAAESRQVLGVVDAHMLPNTPGVGFLADGSGGLHRMTASYVSGPVMVPVASTHSQAAPVVRVWEGPEDPDGQEAKEHEQNSEPDPRGSYVDIVVGSCRAVAEQSGYQAHAMWLPPLPEAISLGATVQRVGHLEVAVGLVDWPFEQRQDPLVLRVGHLALCGGPRMGKTTALASIMVALGATHTTSEVAMYVLDLAGSMLSHAERMPHVAAVASAKEPEKVVRIVEEIAEKLEEPADATHTFLFVDGWHLLTEEFEQLLPTLNRIAADGLGRGIHLVATTPRWAILRPSIRDMISDRYELKMTESLDSLLDRKKQAALAARPGLLLTPQGDYALIARAGIQDFAHVQLRGTAGPPVPRLKLLPTTVDWRELVTPPADAGWLVPMGVGGPRCTTTVWDTRKAAHLMVVGGQGQGKTEALRCVIAALAQRDRESVRIVLIDHRRSLLGEVSDTHLAGYSADSHATAELLRATAETIQGRLPGADITPAQLKARDWWTGPDIFVLIDDADLVQDGALHPLVELLPHARDCGLHVVVARKSGGFQRAMFGQLFAELRDQQAGIVVLGCPKDDGPIMGMKTGPKVPGRADALLGGTDQAVPIQVARVEKEER